MREIMSQQGNRTGKQIPIYISSLFQSPVSWKVRNLILSHTLPKNKYIKRFLWSFSASWMKSLQWQHGPGWEVRTDPGGSLQRQSLSPKALPSLFSFSLHGLDSFCSFPLFIWRLFFFLICIGTFFPLSLLLFHLWPSHNSLSLSFSLPECYFLRFYE